MISFQGGGVRDDLLGLGQQEFWALGAAVLPCAGAHTYHHLGLVVIGGRKYVICAGGRAEQRRERVSECR